MSTSCAYKVVINNSTSPDGAHVYKILMVFADDFFGAAMKAKDAVDRLKEAMLRAGCRKNDVETLDIDKIELECTIVGELGICREGENERFEAIDEWAARVARDAKEDSNA